MKLEVGKTYSNRSGDKIKIIAYNPENRWPFIGHDGTDYTKDGWYGIHGVGAYDLVRPAPDMPDAEVA